MADVKVVDVGARACLVEVEDALVAAALASWVRAAGLAAHEVVPAARTVLIDGVDPVVVREALTGWATDHAVRPGPLVRLEVDYSGPDLARVAEGGPSHGAVALEDAVRPRGRRADEALVERAGVLVGAACGVCDVPVAHPAAGRNGGHDLVEAVGIHEVLLQSVSWPLTLRRGTPNVAVCGCFVTKLALIRDEGQFVSDC